MDTYVSLSMFWIGMIRAGRSWPEMGLCLPPWHSKGQPIEYLHPHPLAPPTILPTLPRALLSLLPITSPNGSMSPFRLSPESWEDCGGCDRVQGVTQKSKRSSIECHLELSVTYPKIFSTQPRIPPPPCPQSQMEAENYSWLPSGLFQGVGKIMGLCIRVWGGTQKSKGSPIEYHLALSLTHSTTFPADWTKHEGRQRKNTLPPFMLSGRGRS